MGADVDRVRAGEGLGRDVHVHAVVPLPTALETLIVKPLAPLGSWTGSELSPISSEVSPLLSLKFTVVRPLMTLPCEASPVKMMVLVKLEELEFTGTSA